MRSFLAVPWASTAVPLKWQGAVGGFAAGPQQLLGYKQLSLMLQLKRVSSSSLQLQHKHSDVVRAAQEGRGWWAIEINASHRECSLL